MKSGVRINTAKVADHRRLRFSSIGDALAEIDRIVAADGAGTLRHIGNWSAGQIMGHLATWIEYSYAGYPPDMRPPWLVRAIARMFKRSFLHRPMRRGFKIPGTADGTWGTQDMTIEEGAQRLRAALDRLQMREPAVFHSPAIGPLTDDERIHLALRHVELHLGFLLYR